MKGHGGSYESTSGKKSRGENSSHRHDFERTSDSQVRASSSGHHETRTSLMGSVYNPATHGFYGSSAEVSERSSYAQAPDVSPASVAQWNNQGEHSISYTSPSYASSQQFSPAATSEVGENLGFTQQVYQTPASDSLYDSYQSHGSSGYGASYSTEAPVASSVWSSASRGSRFPDQVTTANPQEDLYAYRTPSSTWNSERQTSFNPSSESYDSSMTALPYRGSRASMTSSGAYGSSWQNEVHQSSYNAQRFSSPPDLSGYAGSSMTALPYQDWGASSQRTQPQRGDIAWQARQEDPMGQQEAEALVPDIGSEGISQQPHIDPHGREWHLYNPYRQFRSPQEEVYATANLTRLEEHAHIPPKTLAKKLRGWRELKGNEQVSWDQIKPGNFLADPLYAFQKQVENEQTRIVPTDNLNAFANGQGLHTSHITKIWNYGGEHKRWTRLDKNGLDQIVSEGYLLQPRRDQQPKRVHIDSDGREWCFYNTRRQFRSPQEEVYDTANLTRLAEHAQISPNTLANNVNGWRELKGDEQVSWDQIKPGNFLVDPVYAFQKQVENGQTRIVLPDNLTPFTEDERLVLSTITRIWNYGGEHKGWTRLDKNGRDQIVSEGHPLKSRRDQQPKDEEIRKGKRRR